jgi:uncharacterized protein with GYD domain
MPSYLALGHYTQQGLDTMGELEERLAATKQTVTDAGGRLIFFYMTFGQYDFAALTEMPDDDAAARLALQVNRLGNIRTETVRAFTEEEAVALTKSVG